MSHLGHRRYLIMCFPSNGYQPGRADNRKRLSWPLATFNANVMLRQNLTSVGLVKVSLKVILRLLRQNSVIFF